MRPEAPGELVTTKIEQRTRWDFESNAWYVKAAECNGFEYALPRFDLWLDTELWVFSRVDQTKTEILPGNQHESVLFSQALLHHTERLIPMADLFPGPSKPAVTAKQIASIDHYSKVRIAVNVVSGYSKKDFTSIGQWCLTMASATAAVDDS